MQTAVTAKKMKGKDLITVGIFSAIYFVINFIFMLAGGFHPLLWILMPGLIALFTGVPYMLMTAKVQKPGAVLLMGFITGLIYFATGQFTVVILITFVISCGLAELTRYLTGYHRFWGNFLSFHFFLFGNGRFSAADLAFSGEFSSADRRTGNACGLYEGFGDLVLLLDADRTSGGSHYRSNHRRFCDKEPIQKTL